MSRRNETPYEADDGVTKLQEDVLGLLEAAGLPTAINDKIVALIVEGERQLVGDLEPPDPDDGAPCDPLYGQRMDSADVGEN
jgi:hypothetical protein